MKDTLKSVLSGKKADYIEIRVEESKTDVIEFQGPELERAGGSIKFGGSARAFVKGGVGFVSFNRLLDLEEKIDLAIKQAELIGSRTSESTSLSPVSVITDKVTIETVEDPVKLPLDAKINHFKNYNDIILNYGEPVSSSRINYFDKYTKLYYANSEGSYIEQEKLDLGGNITAVATKNGNTQLSRVGFGSSKDFGESRNLENRIRTSCQRAVDMLDAPPIKGGEYTVVLDPTLAGIFVHEAFGHLSESDFVFENPELQKIMKLGTQFGPKDLNIYDTGDVEGSRGFLKYDDEGVKTEKTDLIKEGQLVGRLHTRETASKMDENPTGSARAINYNHPPICRMRTTCIAPGNASFEDMIKDIKEGVYAVDAYGGQTNGEMFTFKAGEAYMIRNGEIAEMVRDVNLTGNVFTTLGNIKAIGNDFMIKDSGGGCGKGGQGPLPTSQGAPSIKIQKVVIGGKN